MCDETVPFHDYNCPECAPQPDAEEEFTGSGHIPTAEDFPEIPVSLCAFEGEQPLLDDGEEACCNPRCQVCGDPSLSLEDYDVRLDDQIIEDLTNENSSLRSELDERNEELGKLGKLVDELVPKALSDAAAIEEAVEASRSYQERLNYAIHILCAIAVNGAPHVESNRELALIALATVSAGESFQQNLENLNEGLR